MADHGLIGELRAVLGEAALKTEAQDMAPYVADWRGRYRGTAACVIEPADVGGVARAVRVIAARGGRIVPQGGNTGMVGGGVPGSAPAVMEVVLSLRRMNRVRDVDVLDNVLVAEAGVILKNAQHAAREAGRLLPISLAAEGSAQIGGVVSTNAGGINVLRYGCARDLLLGLEVVLADGSIWNGLRRLRKDNTGYDLKQLFIGAEGTLGVITAAAFRLSPLPQAQATAFLAVPSPEAAVRLLRHLQSELGDCLSAFELIERVCMELVLGSISETQSPLHSTSPWYVLAEFSTPMKGLAIKEMVEQCLATAFELDLVSDATLAQNETQRAKLWRIREEITEAERRHGPSVKHDISVPVSRMADFLAAAPAAVLAAAPEARPLAFGHVGDGNVHFNVLAPEATADRISAVVYDLVAKLGGSISAEHGIGRSKVALLPRYKDELSLSLMRSLRATLDPAGLFNPGKLVSMQGAAALCDMEPI